VEIIDKVQLGASALKVSSIDGIHGSSSLQTILVGANEFLQILIHSQYSSVCFELE
jgi:hypothetical protein